MTSSSDTSLTQTLRKLRHHPGPLQEAWTYRFNEPQQNRALWLRLSILISKNGFRRMIEVWAVVFEKKGQQEVGKTLLRQSFDIKKLIVKDDGSFQLGDCEFGPRQIRGSLQSKTRSLSWDFEMTQEEGALPGAGRFALYPATLQKLGIVRSLASTEDSRLIFQGKTKLDGQDSVWNGARGMRSHFRGPRNGHSWYWGQCQYFVDERGQAADFAFEGLTVRERIAGPLRTPPLKTFYFWYQGQAYFFNSLWDSIRAKSTSTLNEWEFQVERDDLVFRGKLRAELKDFCGLSFEDTNGAPLFVAASMLSDLQVVVYRKGRLEKAFYSTGKVAYEVVSRKKNPYIPTQG